MPKSFGKNSKAILTTEGYKETGKSSSFSPETTKMIEDTKKIGEELVAKIKALRKYNENNMHRL